MIQETTPEDIIAKLIVLAEQKAKEINWQIRQARRAQWLYSGTNIKVIGNDSLDDVREML